MATTTTPDLDEVRRKLDAACEVAQAKGWRIVPNVTYHEDLRRCCPQGALLVAKPYKGRLIGDRALLARRLGVSERWVRHFAIGFDGDEWDDQLDNPRYRPAYDLGREYRARYVEAGAR